MQNLSRAVFLEKSSALYDELTRELDSNQIDFYEYEKRLESIMLGFTQQILEVGLSDTQVSAHKKKRSDTVWSHLHSEKAYLFLPHQWVSH
jgi:hypothetical protein